ncbi:hypothetical protein KEM56_006393 [Ascosphaera pollenicola]|nr:hypothetical protein KEM56_006393 [Ascosphaera pollenicola]
MAPALPAPDVSRGGRAPTLSYTKTLEARIAELEATIEKLQGSSNTSSPKEDSEPVDDDQKETNGSKNSSRSKPGNALALTKAITNGKSEINGDLARNIEGLKIEDGRVSFHGPTSLFQLPSGMTKEQLKEVQSALTNDGRKERLVNSAWRERAFEQLSSIPEPFQYLLDSHWCWIQPLFNFVYRPAFTRDMKIRGPYYSDSILNAILSHSVRWCKHEPKVASLLDQYDGGAQFFQQATNLTLANVRDGNCSIPVIQSLLLLSAQHCGRGNRTQAWLYSGMAFRLVEDLGITIDSQKYSGTVQFSDEDIEIRNRLFWSCYFWDKLVSLYFGRAPLIQDTPVSPPRLLLDDTAEIDIWTPHGVIFPDGTHYPPTQAHSTSCFMKMCSLSEILNQIITHIYDPLRKSGEAEMQKLVREQSQRLQQWWDELQPFLKLNVQELPPYCPPSHIVTLNCLYHTTNILLHRPTLCARPYKGSRQEDNDANPLVQCITSATSIIGLYDLYRKTFGDAHVVLSLAYSIYTASSIFLLHIQALKYALAPTLDRLRYCVYALERIKGANPVMKTALDLIHQELRKLNIDISEPMNPSQPQPVPSPPFITSSTFPEQLQRQEQHLQQQQQQQRLQQSPFQSHAQPQPQQAPQVSYAIPPPGVFSFASPPMKDQPTPVSVTMETDLPLLAPPDLGNMSCMPGLEITPELFEAFSYVDQLPTNDTSPMFDSTWPSMDDKL